MGQTTSIGQPRLPMEIQLIIIWHLAQDFHPERSATRQDWLRLNKYIHLNHAWFAGFVSPLARSVPIVDIVEKALSASLIDAVLQHHLRRVNGDGTTTLHGQDLRRWAYMCTRRHLARSLERVLAARDLPLHDKDQKRMVSIALREGDFITAAVLVPRFVSPHNLPIRLALGRKRVDILKWMLDRGVPVKGSPWSPLEYAMKTCAKDEEATSISGTTAILQLLLDHGAEPDARDLEMLKQRPRFEKLLLANEPRGDPQACLERMVVHYHRGDHIIDRCLERGADPNVSVKDWPLLSRAIQRRSLAVCEQLLKHGAAPEPECEPIRSPMYHAVRRIGSDYHNLLCKYGTLPRRNYRPRWHWRTFEAYRHEFEYWNSTKHQNSIPIPTSPANPPREVHQPTEKENVREQLKWTAVAEALAYPRHRPSS